MDDAALQNCIRECMQCVQACNRCYYSCLNEEDPGMMKDCIRLDRECASICFYAADALSRGTPFSASIAELCAQICDACGEECARHEHEHCKRCAEVCRSCAEACRRIAAPAA
uniref:Four-helix bundle copper-binding protein n=2 Tax=Cohnella candidum TaxID=2674991 RepID=A0A3G3K518_9BACL|nr:four-helix bundle copper-binding protein [Cohnella candidum]